MGVRDPTLAAQVARCGYAVVSDVADAVVVVAATVEEAHAARRRGLPTLLLRTATGAEEHLESADLVECAFEGPRELSDRLVWLEGHGWRPPVPAPGRLELAARLVEARTWLAALRDAERQAQAAHDADVGRREEHVRAVEAHRNHLIAQIAQMDERLRAADLARAAAEDRMRIAEARLDTVVGTRYWRALGPARALGRRLWPLRYRRRG